MSGLAMNTPQGDCGVIEDQARRGRVRVQLAVGADDPPLGRGDLASRINHLALGAHQRHPVVQGAHHVDFELQRGETLAGR